ncbi:hepatitis A virus cellular receptor 1 [Osmerus eperlanus]|uniref:hepatitis A virus cellular receptor 1 n=1 Tax=Osmerus eperlanus TaxID=29151 RepID=UPI002E0FA924
MRIIYSAAWLVIYLLTVSECGTLVVGVEGQNVTLPCRYDASYHGVLHMCWGRGALPSSGCDDQILSSDGTAVTRTSRYLLSGDLKQGDISLTILNTTERDAGLYGCRVEIPGWFNDLKSEVRLTVEKTFLPTTTRIPDHVTVTPANHSQGHMTANSTESQDVSTTHSSESESDQSGDVALPVILVCAMLLLLVIGALSLVFSRQRRKQRRMPQALSQQSGSSVRYRSSVSSQGLYTRELAAENIYQMDDGDIYINIYEP